MPSVAPKARGGLRLRASCAMNSARFRCFWAWCQTNKDMCPEDKKKILGVIDLDLFCATELFLLVKPSGLFPEVEVDKRIVNCLAKHFTESKRRLEAQGIMCNECLVFHGTPDARNIEPIFQNRLLLLTCTRFAHGYGIY